MDVKDSLMHKLSTQIEILIEPLSNYAARKDNAFLKGVSFPLHTLAWWFDCFHTEEPTMLNVILWARLAASS